MSINTIHTIIAITTLALSIPAPSLSIDAPTSVASGAGFEAFGESTAGEEGTDVTVTHDGNDITSSVVITWVGDTFVIAIDPAPEHDPEGINEIEIIVNDGNDVKTATVIITKT